MPKAIKLTWNIMAALYRAAFLLPACMSYGIVIPMKDGFLYYLIVLFLLGTIIFSGCSSSPPSINYLEIFPVRVYNPQNNSFVFELFAVVNAYSEDGIENIDELYIIKDDKNVYWVNSNENWSPVDVQGEQWISSSRIQLTPGIEPAGFYRAVIVDAAGSTAERDFSVRSLSNAADLQPELSIKDGNIIIDSIHKRHRIIIKDSEDNLLFEKDSDEDVLPLESIGLENVDALISISTAQPKSGYLFSSGPYKLKL